MLLPHCPLRDALKAWYVLKVGKAMQTFRMHSRIGKRKSKVLIGAKNSIIICLSKYMKKLLVLELHWPFAKQQLQKENIPSLE